MAEPLRHWDGGGLERKIRAAGRPWMMGDVAMVVDGQWAVATRSSERRDEESTVEQRITDGRRVHLTLDELARAVGSRVRDTHRDDDPA